MNLQMLNRFLDIPFVDGCESFDGCDCWGLVRLYYQECKGIDLPKYPTCSSANLRQVIKLMETQRMRMNSEWAKVGKQREGNICLMSSKQGKGAGHVGIFIAPQFILHTERGVNTSLTEITHPAIKDRILEYRSYRGD